MSGLTFTVHGLPAAQGSKRYLGVKGGKGITVESSKRVAPWRADVRDAALTALDDARLADYAGAVDLWDAALSVNITFNMPRPKSHYRTGRNAHLLRDGAPTRPAGRPDVDKLTRAILDALSGIVWRDDSQVVDITASKLYGDPGAVITVQVAG